MFRVAPRDLFNDGNLLTNYGHLYIALEKLGLESHFIHINEEEQFNIIQDCDINTYIENVYITDKFRNKIHIFRRLNSRDKYSLWFESQIDYEIYSIFNEDGSLTKEFLNIIKE